MKTTQETVKGRALVSCTSDQGTFSFEPFYADAMTLEQVNDRINKNGNRVVGFRYTNVKAIAIQKRTWVSGERFFN